MTQYHSFRMGSSEVRALVGTGHGRHLKNRESIRKVPIHSSVVDAGVIDWCKQQRGPWLFPLLFPYAGIKKTQWFSAMKQLKIKRPAVALHSLRHTLIQKLARARTFPPLQRRLLGHSIGTATEERVYMGSMTYSVTELSEALEKVTWPKIV
jgi:integrase